MKETIAKELNIKEEDIQIFKNVFDMFDAFNRYLFSIDGKYEDCKEKTVGKIWYTGSLHIPTGKYFCLPSNKVGFGPDNKPIYNRKKLLMMITQAALKLRVELLETKMQIKEYDNVFKLLSDAVKNIQEFGGDLCVKDRVQYLKYGFYNQQTNILFEIPAHHLWNVLKSNAEFFDKWLNEIENRESLCEILNKNKSLGCVL
jgi:hypothetical protein